MVATFPLPGRMPGPSDSLWSRLCYTSLSDALRGRVEGQLDARRAIATFELGEKLSAVVWQMVEKTRLWRSEKVDVARELASHFREGLDAGVGEEELVEQFGDRVTAVKLIRRAKIRGRGWAYFVWTRGWQGLAMLATLVVSTALLVYGVLYLRLNSGKTVIRQDYYANLESQISKTPWEDRAWPFYREALTKVKVDPRENESSSFLVSTVNSLNGSNDKVDWPAVEGYVLQNQEAIQLTRKGAEKPLLGFAAKDPENAVWIPAMDIKVKEELRHYLEKCLGGNGVHRGIELPTSHGRHRLLNLLVTDACVAINNKDSQRFVTDFQAILGFEKHLDNRVLDSKKRAFSEYEGIGFYLLSQVLHRHPEMLTDAELQKLRTQLEQYDWQKYAKSRSDYALGQKEVVDEFLQHFYTDDGSGDGHITIEGMAYLDLYQSSWPQLPTPKNVELKKLDPVRSAFFSSRKQLKETSDEVLDGLASVYKLPPWEQLDRQEELRVAFKKLDQIGNRSLVVILSLFSPEAEPFSQHYAPTARGVFIGICLELFKREHGRWPNQLEELVPKYAAEVPVDWATGKPLGYKVAAAHVLVYSVGGNRKDDGGRMEADPKNFDRPFDFPVWQN